MDSVDNLRSEGINDPEIITEALLDYERPHDLLVVDVLMD